MTKYLLYAIIGLSLALAISIKSCNGKAAEASRLSVNQSVLFEKVRYYRTNDSLSVASVGALTLTMQELQRHNTELVKTVENLNIKIKRLQSASTTATETKYKVTTEVVEKVVYQDGKTDTLRCMTYSDPWLTFDGCISKGIFNGTIESSDTLVQIVHRVPRKFLFIKYGTKAIRQEVVSKNPHSNIVYTEYIELKK